MPKKMIAALIFLAVGGWGCGAGGCGENPQDSKTADSQPAGDGRAAPGGGTVAGGKEEAKVAGAPSGDRFDTASKGAGATGAAEQAQEAAGAAGQKLAGPSTIFDIQPEDFSRVLKAALPAFVMVSGPDCENCDVVMPSLRGVSRDLRGRFEFYRIDAAAVGASGVLPPDMLSPLPAFLLYEKGKPVSSRKKLPFAREAGHKDRPDEAVADYQKRLYRWFRDAVMQKNLGFGGS